MAKANRRQLETEGFVPFEGCGGVLIFPDEILMASKAFFLIRDRHPPYIDAGPKKMEDLYVEVTMPLREHAESDGDYSQRLCGVLGTYKQSFECREQTARTMQN